MRGGRPGGENRWAWLVVAAVLALSILAFVNRPGPTESRATDRTEATPSAEATSTPASASPSARPRRTPSPSAEQPSAAGVDLPENVPAGLGGSGNGRSLTRAALSIRITSTSPLHKVSYIIPTSDGQQYGEDDGVGTSWSHRTKVWGKPDYAAVFVHALYPGVKVTCVITVNGRETERRTIIGPYGAMWCQG